MKKLFLGLYMLVSFSSIGQTYQQVAQEIIDSPKKNNKGEALLDIAKHFLGKPYVAQTLEKKPENLVFNLKEFDCYTLVENTLALALAKYNPEAGLDAYKEYLQMLRYQGGVINGYASRMHYFIDWANQAIENDILINISEELGEIQDKPLFFMSKNRKLYSGLAEDSQWKAIQQTEMLINEREFYYIPKEKFSSIEKEVEDGDIIAFTSNIPGLDVNHEGFAIWQNGKLHLLHASLEEKKVIISKETLNEYLHRIKKHSGVVIYRYN